MELNCIDAVSGDSGRLAGAVRTLGLKRINVDDSSETTTHSTAGGPSPRDLTY